MLPLLALSLLVPNLDISLPAGPGPVTNPLKGYAPYVEPGNLKDVPSTMTFFETSWRELEPKEGEYRFAEWEAKTFKAAPNKVKHVVLRVYMDYPNQGIGLPQYLIDAGVKMTPYSDDGIGTGKSPDYRDPRLRKALSRLIAAMGVHWDRDPQVAFIQLGLLGHWGEWHTYPRAELFAPADVQKEVVDKLHAAFPHKQLMARTATDYLGKHAWMGFHDDMIPDDTLGPEDWKFLSNLKAAKRDVNWKVAPTGGEMVPGAAKRYLGTDWELMKRAVRDVHLTWIGPYCPLMANSDDPTYKERAAELSRMLGYEFRLDRAKVTGNQLHVEGVNQGVAPFYYPWTVRVALIANNGYVVSTVDAKADPREWLPGKFNFSSSIPKPPGKGRYRLAVGLIDPWKGVPTVRFANRLDVVGGWTVLSTLSL